MRWPRRKPVVRPDVLVKPIYWLIAIEVGATIVLTCD
jgi:hypothetical protein